MRGPALVPTTIGELAVLAFASVILAGASEAVAQHCAFPFTIQGDRFYREGKPVFLHMICYQPLEPGQGLWSPIEERRIQDDLRRMRAYVGGSDPILLRVYAQPTNEIPRMPKSFYDGMRELGFWIVRDIYLSTNYADFANGTNQGKIDLVINEVTNNCGMDRIFAWEIGTEEFPTDGTSAAQITNFLCQMRDYITNRASLAEPGRGATNWWVTWGSWPPRDPLRSESTPIIPTCLDYVSYNAYSYEPERIRDHQPGPVTGTPYQGYLAALKERYPDKPLVVSETGLADSPSAEGVHTNLRTWYPVYRKGGLTNAQVAEGLADRYWDARLLTNIAGISYFEWNDEWWKPDNANIGIHDDRPEEWFGLTRFETNVSPPEARFKLQQETVRDLFTLRFRTNCSGFSLTASHTNLPIDGFATMQAILPSNTPAPLRFRWEASRGYITGDSEAVQFCAGGRALGPAKVTAVAIDASHQVWTRSTTINIQTSGPPSIELLTLGLGAHSQASASGRVRNVNLDDCKVVVYIQCEDEKHLQPYTDMPSVWVRPDGYWWTPVINLCTGKLAVCLADKSYDPTNLAPEEWPPDAIAPTVLTNANDLDNDLLPDAWETNHFGGTDFGRYDDRDGDGANLLEEFLAGRSPTIPDNDLGDGLPDNWELHFFGHLDYGPSNDPDGDGLDNATELRLGLHPGRTAVDRDRDRLPDLWELRWFGSLAAEPTDNFNCDGWNYLDDYELGYDPPPLLRLGIRRASDDCVELSWPTNAACFSLWSTVGLNQGAAWTEVANARATNGNQFVVTVCGLTNSSGFFRLRR